MSLLLLVSLPFPLQNLADLSKTYAASQYFENKWEITFQFFQRWLNPTRANYVQWQCWQVAFFFFFSFLKILAKMEAWLGWLHRAQDQCINLLCSWKNSKHLEWGYKIAAMLVFQRAQEEPNALADRHPAQPHRLRSASVSTTDQLLLHSEATWNDLFPFGWSALQTRYQRLQAQESLPFWNTICLDRPSQ